MDNADDVMKSIERKRLSPFAFIGKIDKKILLVSVVAIAIFIYLYTTGGLEKQTLIMLIGTVIILILIMGNREMIPKVIPIEEVMVIMKDRLKKIGDVNGRDTDIVIDNIFILYHVNWEPKSYDVLWRGTINKKEFTFVTEVDAIRGHLIKTRTADEGWNCDKPTNTIVETRYVPDSKMFEYETRSGKR